LIIIVSYLYSAIWQKAALHNRISVHEQENEHGCVDIRWVED